MYTGGRDRWQRGEKGGEGRRVVGTQIRERNCAIAFQKHSLLQTCYVVLKHLRNYNSHTHMYKAV